MLVALAGEVVQSDEQQEKMRVLNEQWAEEKEKLAVQLEQLNQCHADEKFTLNTEISEEKEKLAALHAEIKAVEENMRTNEESHTEEIQKLQQESERMLSQKDEEAESRQKALEKDFEEKLSILDKEHETTLSDLRGSSAAEREQLEERFIRRQQFLEALYAVELAEAQTRNSVQHDQHAAFQLLLSSAKAAAHSFELSSAKESFQLASLHKLATQALELLQAEESNQRQNIFSAYDGQHSLLSTYSSSMKRLVGRKDVAHQVQVEELSARWSLLIEQDETRQTLMQQCWKGLSVVQLSTTQTELLVEYEEHCLKDLEAKEKEWVAYTETLAGGVKQFNQDVSSFIDHKKKVLHGTSSDILRSLKEWNRDVVVSFEAEVFNTMSLMKQQYLKESQVEQVRAILAREYDTRLEIGAAEAASRTQLITSRQEGMKTLRLSVLWHQAHAMLSVKRSMTESMIEEHQASVQQWSEVSSELAAAMEQRSAVGVEVLELKGELHTMFSELNDNQDDMDRQNQQVNDLRKSLDAERQMGDQLKTLNTNLRNDKADLLRRLSDLELKLAEANVSQLEAELGNTTVMPPSLSSSSQEGSRHNLAASYNQSQGSFASNIATPRGLAFSSNKRGSTSFHRRLPLEEMGRNDAMGGAPPNGPDTPRDQLGSTWSQSLYRKASGVFGALGGLSPNSQQQQQPQ